MKISIEQVDNGWIVREGDNGRAYVLSAQLVDSSSGRHVILRQLSSEALGDFELVLRRKLDGYVVPAGTDLGAFARGEMTVGVDPEELQLLFKSCTPVGSAKP